MVDDAAVEVSVPEHTTIPSGDDSVWADVSPLLESACKERVGERERFTGGPSLLSDRSANNHKREVGDMEDAMKSLENKNLGFEKKNGHHYYMGWDEIYEEIMNLKQRNEFCCQIVMGVNPHPSIFSKDNIPGGCDVKVYFMLFHFIFLQFCGKSNGIEVE
ncbi:hypothetical protein SO802_010657 [Lithocarpus litseifolius]|uniref:Uncharacterized protein n=1 Tax=Lithocarpus litseifolius TaxID=425828 RepID=A0AAW2DIM7_9ROSI